MSLQVPMSINEYGFTYDRSAGIHTSRTMMLAELRLLLTACDVSATLEEYRTAAVVENALLKDTLTMHFDQSFPADSGAAVPMWIRDEWSVSERTVRDDAQRVGMDNPIVFVFLPKQDTDALNDALASYIAASETVASRMTPGTDEGLEARSAMQSRSQMAQNRRDDLIEKIVKNARVFQGGGNQVNQGTFPLSAKEAIDDALIRLFPHFTLADHPSWGTVAKRAREGAADALIHQ